MIVFDSLSNRWTSNGVPLHHFKNEVLLDIVIGHLDQERRDAHVIGQFAEDLETMRLFFAISKDVSPTQETTKMFLAAMARLMGGVKM